MLTLLLGGPQDGKVAETAGTMPAFLLTTPEPRSLLDEPAATARWNPVLRWYERVEP